MKKTHFLCLASAFAALIATPLNAQNEQPKEFGNNNYRMKFLTKNELGKTYGTALDEVSGLRELLVQGKVYLQQYRFEIVLPGKNVPSTPKPGQGYRFDGKNFNAKKTLIDVNTGKEFAELNTDAVFSETSYTVTHTMRPLEDFTIKIHGQPEETLAMPIENVKLANVTAWKADGTKNNAIFPALSQKDNWGMNGNFSKLEIRTSDTVVTITGSGKTILKLDYLANLAKNTLWRNPTVKIRPHLSLVNPEVWKMKKDVPLAWGYTVSIEKIN